jgi:hypothetical protein
MTRGTVIRGEGSGLWPAGVEDMRRKECIKISLWHLYAQASTKRKRPDGRRVPLIDFNCVPETRVYLRQETHWSDLMSKRARTRWQLPSQNRRSQPVLSTTIEFYRPPLKLVLLLRGLYARVARKLRVDPSYVSRVARGERQSARVEKAIQRELRDTVQLLSKMHRAHRRTFHR